MTAAELTCPACAAPIAADETFCEACGVQLQGSPMPPAAPPAAALPVTVSIDDTAPIPRTVVVSSVCTECGGRMLDDGFCGTCGQKAR